MGEFMDTFSRAYEEKARRVAAQMPGILANRGLEPLFSRFVLADNGENAWLFAVLDKGRLHKLEAYSHPSVVHHLSTSLGGLPVFLSNTTGLRYAVLLSPKPALPEKVLFTNYRKGLFAMGCTIKGEAVCTWRDLGNVLVAGMTRSGKSNFLRLLVAQGMADTGPDGAGLDFLICDPDGSTFPDLTGAVLGYANNIAGSSLVVEQAFNLLMERIEENNLARAEGSSTPAFRRTFLIIDEFTGLVAASDGPRGRLASLVSQVAWGGLKYGLHVVLGGHEFTKALVGPVAGQMATRLCFAVRQPSVSRIVAGRAGAERIRTPGRALSDPWGYVQVYQAPEMAELLKGVSPDGLTEEERALISWIKHEHGGRVTFRALQEKGMSRGQAEKVRHDWMARGLAVQSPAEDNALILSV